MDKEDAREPFKGLARMGYSARGVIYLVVGALAILTAVGEGGETTGSKGAIMEILRQPFGTTLIAILIVGLVGYVLWRFTQAIADPDRHGRSGKGLAIRAGLVASAITHTVLAYWTLQLLLSQVGASDGGGSGSGDAQKEAFLATGAGQILMGVIGVVLIGVGFAHMFKGWTARFEKYMTFPPNHRGWACPLCQFGLIARGVVWVIVGWFFIDSARRAYGNDIKGVAEALDTLRTSPYGDWLLGIVAAGLFAFGLYSLLEAVYRRLGV